MRRKVFLCLENRWLPVYLFQNTALDRIQYIHQHSNINKRGITNTLALLDADATIPFISRYRKEQTGNLDEQEIAEIQKLAQQFQELENRRASILKTIEDQEALTPELETRINAAITLTELEDLYLPFKKKRKTRADMAKEKGLEPLAKMLMAQAIEQPLETAARFISGDVSSAEDAMTGALDIVAEWINERERVRTRIRKLFQNKAVLVTRVVKKQQDEEGAQKFMQYFEWEESLRRVASHRFLAMQRGQKEGFLRLKVEVPVEIALDQIRRVVLKSEAGPCAPYLKQAISDSFKRLLQPAISNEVLAEARQRAEDEAIKVFSENLRQLLLAPPLGQKRILALDPGFKSGCKLVCLDQRGDLLYNETIFPHPPQRETTQAIKKLRSLVNSYNIEAIAIGNGTASRETETLVKKVAFDRQVQVFVVNEAGASVYSASKIAREEFPQYDVTVRGAVSIGRRLADPLAELVKIDPKAIGVGQYQHDVDQTNLKRELDRVVESCVNRIGVNVNTASAALLQYVSGIGPGLAGKIVDFRRQNGAFSSRKELLKVPQFGPKAFEQAAGFLRITSAANPLDNSAVHPESYFIVEQMARDQKVEVEDLIGNQDLLQKIIINQYLSDTLGLPTLQDILDELEKPGLDPRRAAKVFEFDPSVKKIEDLQVGMKLPGIVNNITNFGCFVDIGIKESGLVHISKLARRYVSDVNDVVSLHQHVQVTVLEVDLQRKRIQLSLVD